MPQTEGERRNVESGTQKASGRQVFYRVKTHSLEHEHILSGIIKCPVCGSGMYGNVNRKKHPDGSYYKDYFYYACKHRKLVGGHRCTYKRQWNEDRINAEVEEIIRKFVKNPKV